MAAPTRNPPGTGVAWFRPGLHVNHNPVFAAATGCGQRVVALFVIDQRLASDTTSGAAGTRTHDPLHAMQVL